MTIGKKKIKYTKVKSSEFDVGINNDNESKADDDFRESNTGRSSVDVFLNEPTDDIQFNAPSKSKRPDFTKTFIWTVLLLMSYFVLSIGMTFTFQPSPKAVIIIYMQTVSWLRFIELTLFCFCFIGLTFYQQWLLKVRENNYGSIKCEFILSLSSRHCLVLFFLHCHMKQRIMSGGRESG